MSDVNVNAPVSEMHSNTDSWSFIAPNQLAAQQNESGSASSSSKESASGIPSALASMVEAKMDLILKRMDELENKNKVFDQQVVAKNIDIEISYFTQLLK